MYARLYLESQHERDRLEFAGANGRIILKQILKKVWECEDWIHLAQNREKYRAPLNMVMNFLVPQYEGNF
jgi:hypothetical protein